jgi:hypothetical protein
VGISKSTAESSCSLLNVHVLRGYLYPIFRQSHIAIGVGAPISQLNGGDSLHPSETGADKEETFVFATTSRVNVRMT